MIKNICKDVMFLSRKSEAATKEDLPIAKDLIDTLIANKDKCIGMAANMIGYNKSIIVVSTGMFPVVMFNPVITGKRKMYNASEGCLSLKGERPCIRYEEIDVTYYDMSFNKKTGTYTGLISEIIQHEVDHLNGIII